MPESGENPARERVEQLLLSCQDRLLARIRWMMGDQARRLAESEDFLGEVMARILTEADSLRWRDADHFLALATRIARNLIVDRVRRPRVQRFDSFSQSLCSGNIADGPSPSQAAGAGEDIERILTMLDSLSPDHQRVIELRDFEGLAFREIGEQMERTESAVQLLHARAMIQLGRALRSSSE